MILPYKDGEVRVTSPFGWRTLNGKKENHKGVDLVGTTKTLVSPCDGTILVSRIVTDKANRTSEWGNYICIDASNGVQIYMCHMEKRLVKAGQKVKAGTPVGIEGNTGYSFGSHCHFEIRKNGVSVDPCDYLGIQNKVGQYNVRSLNAADYVDKIIEKVGFDKPADVKTALLGVKHNCPDELYRKIYEKMK